MRNSILTLLLLFISISAWAQTDIKFQDVDQKTYSYYMNNEWDSLIMLGRKAVKQEINYYYLNYRMGVAYFYKNNYRMATYYLQKALGQNKQALEDDFFVEIIHLSYVYGQRTDLAMDIPMPINTKTLDPLVRTKLGLFFGVGQFGDVTKANNELPSNVDYAELRYQKYMSYIGLGIQHQFNSSFKLSVGYSNMRFMNQAIFQEDSAFSEVYDISQNNISILPEFTIGQKWQIRPAMAVSLNSGRPYSLVDTINGLRFFDYWDYKETNIMLGMNLYRHIKNVKLGVSFGYSNYSSRNQFQFGASATYYPFGNLNLYSNTALSLKNDGDANDFVFDQSIGFKTFSILWVELGGTFGEIKNYNDFAMGYGYNLPDQMTGILYGKLIFSFGKNISLFLEGKYLIKNTIRTEYYNSSEIIETKIGYTQRNFEGGLLWKF